jgi:integrase
MAGVRNKPRKSGKYQGFFINSEGRRQFFAGVRNREETLRMARRLEDDHRQVALGYRPGKTKTDRYRTRLYSEIAADYLKWGCTQGGRGGRPWSDGHAARRRYQMTWWQKQLGLETLGDLDNILPEVERVAQEMLAAGKTGKTVSNEVEGLSAFCDWCVKRKFLRDDPLAALAPFDTTPQTTRRAMTREELARLLDVAPPDRRLLYETAFVSGLRVPRNCAA